MRLLRCRYPFEPWDCSVCGRAQDRPPVSVKAGLACESCIDRGRRGEPFVPLTVAPAKPRTEHDDRPIYAVCMRDGQVLTEHGETFELDQLPARLRERKPGEAGRVASGAGWHATRTEKVSEQLPAGIVVTDAGVDLIGFLDRSELGKHSLWQWQLGLRSHAAWRPEARSKSRFEFVVPRPVRFGFASQRNGRRRAKGRARWYQVLDVSMFIELPEGWGEPDAGELLTFGLDLRSWANRNQLPILTSASAYGGRLLRDARFGGGWRRKVPAATNESLRAFLPGNHYQLLGDRPIYPRAHKLDQQRAHHYATFVTRFPDANRLEAHGHWRQPQPRELARFGDRGPIKAGSERWRELLDQAGLFVIAARVPELVAIDQLAIPAFRKSGIRWRVLTSVEIEHARRLHGRGVRLLDIWCCWTSPDDDDRLREYAYWSSRQLDRQPPGIKRWLKPTLLAAYGMLAVRPNRFRNAWKWCGPGDGAIGWQTRYGTLIGTERSGTRERESQTANVLWRALIESQVRLESLTFAQQLRAQRFRPVSVYADAVFATGQGTPPAPLPWRYEGVVTDLEFESPQRYRSREELRLPGTPRRRGFPVDHNEPVFPERSSAIELDELDSPSWYSNATEGGDTTNGNAQSIPF